MKSPRISRHFFAMLLPFVTTAMVIGVNPGGSKRTEWAEGTVAEGTVTHHEPPRNDLTPGAMRAAKPFPLPSVEGPPVPQQTTPLPFTEPPGSSPPGNGNGKSVNN